jgi:hypothetical protein
MILEEFVYMKEKENKIKKDLKGKENFNDDRSKYEWEKESECCEPVCRPRSR